MEEEKGYNVVYKTYGSKLQTKIFKNPVGKPPIRSNGFSIDRSDWATKRKKASCIEHLEKIIENQERSLYSSASRSKQTIIDLARANEWEHFVTLTFDKNKVDRYNYDACQKKLKDWIDYQRKLSLGIKYLFVPEMHKNGAWHFHGLVSDWNPELIKYSGRNCIGKKSFESEEDSGVGIPVYNFGKYKLGWNTLTKIQDNQKVSFYIAKYLTKELLNVTQKKRRYLSSQNLEKPIVNHEFLSDEDKKNLQKCLETSADFGKHVSIDHPTYQNEMLIFESSIT